MNSEGRDRSKWIRGCGLNWIMFRGESVRGRLRKMVWVRVHPKSCILSSAPGS